MKILYVSPYPPARDGIGTYTQHLAGAMRRLGHDVRILIPRPMPEYPDEVIGILEASALGSADLGQEILHWQPDVVHVQFAVAAFGTRTSAVLRWLSRLRRQLDRVAVVATLHEVTRDIGTLRTPGRMLYRALAGHCDKIIVHTQAALADVTHRVGLPARKVIVIPHPDAQPSLTGTPAAELRTRFGLDGATVFLAFGFIHVDKGLDDLVEALGMLRHSRVAHVGDARLVIAGTVRRRQGLFRAFEARDHRHYARVLRLAQRLGLRQQLVTTGYVPEHEIAGWFGAADAVVLPYRRTEQSGVASLANAFGVPVIASTAGGLGEQFSGTPWTFPPRDRRRLAAVLEAFLGATPGQRTAAARLHRTIDVGAVAALTVDVYAAARAAIGGLLHAT